MRRYLLPALLLPVALGAQPKRKIESEVSGNVFFGNTRQVLAATRLEFERADSGFAFKVLGRLNYGEQTTEGIGTLVSKRSWNTGANYDFHPFADFTPFVKLATEASFENRIARRHTAASGLRYNVRRTPATDVIYSLGVAGERTAALPPGDSVAPKTLARATTTMKVRRDFTPRMSATHETTYNPALSSNDYTIVSITTVKSRLASFAALTFTFRDNYDSRAVRRGARVNNDGEILVGLLTTF